MIHEELWKKLNAMDPYEVSRNSLASYDKNSHTFSLKILTRTYLIKPKLQSVTNRENSSSPPEYHLQLSAINYLIGSKDIPLIGKWVSEKEFPSGPIFFRGHHAMPTKELEQIFGNDPDGFSAACMAFRGKKVEGGDIAFEFQVFPRIPVRLILWLADEEFPARVSYLFDRSANLHLQLDALWAVGKTLESALLNHVEEKNKRT
jgi:hypothetical protein